MEILRRIRTEIRERRRETADEKELTSSWDDWLIDMAKDEFEPSPKGQSDPDVLVVTGDGIKER